MLNKRTLGTIVLALSAFHLHASESAQRIHGEISDASRFTLNGHVRPSLASAEDLGPVSSSTNLSQMAIYFTRTPSQNADLLQLLRLQQTRNSSKFHQWLTPEQFADRYGLNEKDIQKVTAWLESMGFSNVQASRSRTSISFSGSAAQAEMAFDTSIHQYRVNGVVHYANATEPRLPGALSNVVESVRGLHDFHPKPHARPHFTSSLSGNHFLVPDDFATIYDIKALYNSGIDGTGKTIAIPGQTDIVLSDIEAFQTAAGLPVKDPQIILTGADPGQSSGDLGESDLDIEWAGGIAKGASIIYVNSTDVFTSLSYAIQNNLADVVAVTYGDCESDLGSAEMTYLNSLFMQANAQGTTVIAASGDDGAADCDSGRIASQGLAVDVPAASPYVTGIGGTEFNEGSGNYWNSTNNSNSGSAISYIPEIAWNDTNADGTLTASGGGASTLNPKPSWQTGTGVPNDGARDVPDLAFNASADHDGYLFCSGGSCVNGFRDASQNLNVSGGTSAGSPTFAAIMALLDQKLGARQGNVDPNLYAVASYSSNAFHDITSGNNIVPCRGGSPNCSSTTAGVNGTLGYSATTGYDQVTGLGSVDAFNLFEEWTGDFSLAPTPTSLSIQPGTSGTSTINVQSSGNFNGNVTFACSVSTSLANTTCSVPGTVSGGSGSVTLTVTAASNAGSRPYNSPFFPGGGGRFLWLIAGLLGAACALSFAKRKSSGWAVAAASIVLTIGLSSCGSGSSSTSASISSNTTNPAESGTITITGTSGSITNSTTISVSIP